MSNVQAETFARQEEDEARRLSGLKTLFDPATLVRKGTSSVIRHPRSLYAVSSEPRSTQ